MNHCLQLQQQILSGDKWGEGIFLHLTTSKISTSLRNQPYNPGRRYLAGKNHVLIVRVINSKSYIQIITVQDTYT